MVQPTPAEPKGTASREEGQPAAYVGLDAFSVPRQGPGAGKAEQRLLYTALLYTPQKEHTRSLVDFELDTLAEPVRAQAQTLGLAPVSEWIAGTDGGNGLEEALQRPRAENRTTLLDGYHAAEPLGDFAKVWHARDEAARAQWHQQAQGILSAQGGEALLRFLQAIEWPPGTSGEVQEEWRKRIGYFENHRHRTA